MARTTRVGLIILAVLGMQLAIACCIFLVPARIVLTLPERLLPDAPVAKKKTVAYPFQIIHCVCRPMPVRHVAKQGTRLVKLIDPPEPLEGGPKIPIPEFNAPTLPSASAH